MIKFTSWFEVEMWLQADNSVEGRSLSYRKSGYACSEGCCDDWDMSFNEVMEMIKLDSKLEYLLGDI